MDSLTQNQITLLVTFVGLVAAVVGWIGRGLSFVLARWWTNSPKHDRATYLNSVADLAAKLRANGMTIEDVSQLEGIMHNPNVVQSNAANKVVEELAEESEPEAFHSNFAMKARTGAAYTVAEAQLEQALMDLRLLISEEQAEVLDEVQKTWQEYRHSIEDYALREYKGGTHATLALALAGLSETERRTEEVRREIADRAAR